MEITRLGARSPQLSNWPSRRKTYVQVLVPICLLVFDARELLQNLQAFPAVRTQPSDVEETPEELKALPRHGTT